MNHYSPFVISLIFLSHFYRKLKLFEYIEKLTELGIAKQLIEKLTLAIVTHGIEVAIEYFHLRYYPTDPDDIAFLLCAVNGEATHIVSHDRHLLQLNTYYSFRICKTTDFLVEFRQM